MSKVRRGLSQCPRQWELIDKYNGNIRVALGAYNWGMGNAAKVGNKEEKFPKSVKEHIKRVLELKAECEKRAQDYYEKK